MQKNINDLIFKSDSVSEDTKLKMNFSFHFVFLLIFRKSGKCFFMLLKINCVIVILSIYNRIRECQLVGALTITVFNLFRLLHLIGYFVWPRRGFLKRKKLRKE